MHSVNTEERGRCVVSVVNILVTRVLLLLLRSPGMSLGFTILGEMFAYVTGFFSPSSRMVHSLVERRPSVNIEDRGCVL